MLPALEFPADPSWMVPDEELGALLWDMYDMMPHIRDHCRAVACVATEIVRRAEERGIIPAGRALSVPLARAAALLDIRLLDHIIVADGDFVSMEASGLLYG